MKRFIFLATFSLALFLTKAVSADTLVFGIVPQQSAKKLAETWSPLLRELSKITGKKIVFATAKDIPTFEKRLANQEYDLAYMNPYHYVTYSKHVGYNALAKQRDKKIQGIIVVHKNNPAQSLQDLHGKTLAFPAPASFAATIIPQASMKKLGIETTPRYVSSHDSVYLNVSREFMFAGGGVVRTLNAVPETTRQNLRILWRSDKFTPHAIASSGKINKETRQLVLDALLQLNDKPEYEPLLKAISFKGFEDASDKDWNDVRDLNIQVVLPEAQ